MSGNSHSHTHDGKPCGGHGHDHGGSHGHSHGHTHDGQPCGGHGDLDSQAVKDAQAEAEAMTDVVAAFLYYKTYSLNTGIYRRLHSIDELSDEHREIVTSLGLIDKIKKAEELIRENYKFILSLTHENTVGSMPNPKENPDELREFLKMFFAYRERTSGKPAKDHHMDKVISILKQFVRDWSAEGKEEREATYGPIMQALEDEFAGVTPEERGKINVLVPGAGLGRLAYDICCRGFSSQGNEFSYFMLFASNFILNKVEKPEEITIYPFVHQFSNVVKAEDQMRAVRIPDVLPSELPYKDTAEFSMTAGDFIEVYGDAEEKDKWDAIVTCFFMDTAKNAIKYLETMWHAMKPGAVWINL
ncbi:hypothetical protein FBU59_003308, partial [Linderina macrospora]